MRAHIYFPKFFILLVASYLGAQLGFALLPVGVSTALVWPASAIGMAALFLYGYELWPAVYIGVITALYFRNGNLPLDIFVALGNTLEALLGAYILKKYVKFNPLINTLGNGFGVIIASFIPTLVSGGVISFASFYLGQTNLENIELLWTTLWLGHAVSCLSLAPFLIRWTYRPFFTKTPQEVSEGIVIFSSITIISYLLFWTTYVSIGQVSLVYILILPLLWAALRTGPRGTTLALAMISLISTTGVVFGGGPLSSSHNPQTVFLLQILLGVMDLIFILIASIIEERKDIMYSLAANVAELSLAVEKISREDRAKTNFLAILAHELRNPLAPIVSSVELLKANDLGEENTALLTVIESQVQTVSILLEDLLDITRITHNKLELKPEPLVIQSVLKKSFEQ